MSYVNLPVRYRCPCWQIMAKARKGSEGDITAGELAARSCNYKALTHGSHLTSTYDSRPQKQVCVPVYCCSNRYLVGNYAKL